MSSRRSKVHPKYKTKYGVSNWPAYDRSLVARGDLTVWITPDALDAWCPAQTGRRGAQPKFSDLAIETALTLRMVFHLPLRQAKGFLRSILRIMGLDLESPDHTTLSRRGQDLPLDLRALPHQGPIHLLIDSSGLSAYGEGEWAAAKHGAKGRRGWRKLHLSVPNRVRVRRCIGAFVPGLARACVPAVLLNLARFDRCAGALVPGSARACVPAVLLNLARFDRCAGALVPGSVLSVRYSSVRYSVRY